MNVAGEDFKLLRRYAEQRDEAAFAAIVRRYIDMVYSAVQRRVGERTLAEDITQAVFLILAQKANSFREGTMLRAWLLKTVRYASVNALRIETRRVEIPKGSVMPRVHQDMPVQPDANGHSH
jgi:RNA polymerase sigma factor (sigma-70 family)